MSGASKAGRSTFYSTSAAGPMNCDLYKPGVGAVFLEQVGVGSLLDDAPVLHDQDDVGAANGGQAMGDNETGPVRSQSVHRQLYLHLRASVHRAGGLVEDEH